MRRGWCLKTLLLLAFVPVVLIPLIMVAAMVDWRYREERRTVETRIEGDLLTLARMRKRLVEGILRNMVDAARVAAASSIRNEPRPDRFLADLAEHSRALQDLCVLSPSGAIRYSSVPIPSRERWIPDATWVEFQRQRSLTFTAPMAGPGGRMLIRLLLPMEDGGSLVASYDLSQLEEAFQNPPASHEGRFFMILDQEGRVIAHPDPRMAASHADLHELPPVRQSLRGLEGTMAFRDPRTGEELSAAFVTMPLTGWSLVSFQPSAASMLVPPAVANRDALLILSGGIGLAIGCTTLLCRILAQPVVSFSHQLEVLARQVGSVRPGPVPWPQSRIMEYQRVIGSFRILYDSLVVAIAELEVKTTELDFANRQMADTVENLRRLERLRADFLNALSHDLRIPLTSLLGYAELLQEAADPPLGETQQEWVRQMMEGCRRMQAMLEELLDYARLEVGRLKIHPAPVDAVEAIHEMVAFFAPLAAQKRVSLAMELPTNMPPVWADPDRIGPILGNLLSNAIKYTPPGGAVTVRACTRGERGVIEVQDTGIGLSPEDKRHLFEKFYRSARPQVQAEEGSGLGLVLVKGLLEAQEGSLEVDSEQDQGSTFRLDFRLAASTLSGTAGGVA